MKRAILVLILLTVGVTIPPFYEQWAESQRLKQIREVKQQARTVFGDQLEMVLSKLQSGEPPSVVILYTGGTKSHLEPCGCYQEQSGGLPRRAYVVERFREHGVPTLLVDAGNIFDGEAEIDAKRCETNMKALAEMGYAAVALSPSDLAYDDTFLRRQRAVATFPFLSSTQNGFTQPFTLKRAGQQTIGFVTGEVSEEAVSQADVIVTLGEPEETAHIDVVICPDERAATVSENGTLYVGCKSEGKTLGMLALWLGTDGKLARHYATELALTRDVGESASIRQFINRFLSECCD